MRELAGRELGGRYRLIRQAGVGSTSTVWEATDLVLQRTVAVKVINEDLQSDVEFIEQFRQEAMAAARLSGPGVVPVYDTIREPDLDAVVLEYLTGMALRDFLHKYAPLEAPDTVDLGVQVLTALATAHDAGVIHARVSPNTIILCDDRRVKITDTGFLVIAALDTGPYTAPEVIGGAEGDPRSDVFSVGVVLYECLTGALPYANRPEQGQAPSPMASTGVTVAPQLESSVARALAISPAARYQNATDFSSALSQIDLHREVPPVHQARTESVADLDDRPKAPDLDDRRKASALVAAAIAALVVLAGLGLIATAAGRDAVRDMAEAIGLVGTEGSDGSATEPAPPTAATPSVDQTTTTTLPQGAVISLVAATAFDPPPGSGSEHDELTLNAIDGNPTTAWNTESYANRSFGGLKDGVGLIVETIDVGPITTIDVMSPSQGWSLEIYAAARPAADLAGWGEPLAGASAVAGNAQFDLGGISAGAVLVWITDLGNAAGPLRVDIGEVTLHSGGPG
jgi:serine/threonine protein kinase